MSNYTKYYSTRQNAYRTLGTMASNLKTSAQLSKTEAAGTARFLTSVAKRFGLITEFKKLGLI